MFGIEPRTVQRLPDRCTPTEVARFPLFLLWSSVFWHRVVSKEYAACFYSVEVGWGCSLYVQSGREVTVHPDNTHLRLN